MYICKKFSLKIFIMKKTLVFLFVSLFFHLCSFSQGYEISVKIKGLKNAKLLLGHHFNKNMYPDDTIMLNQDGFGVFKKKKTLTGGMYLIFLPNRTFFDIMVDKNQKFLLETDTTQLVDFMKVTGDEQNKIFFEYQRFLGKQGKAAKEFRDAREKSKADTAKVKEINKKLAEVDVQVKERILSIIKQYPEMFFSKFLKATLDVEIPAELLKTMNDTERYYYWKNHFLDNFDVSDGRLLRTPIYEDIIKNYLDNVIPQHPDTVISEVDKLLLKSRTSEELFRYMLVTLYNKYATSQIMSFENVFVHIAKEYYIPEAKWSNKEFVEDLKKKVARKEPNLVGKIAPELTMQEIPRDTVMIRNLRKQLTEMRKEGTEARKDTASINNEAKILKKTNPKKADSTLQKEILINNRYGKILQKYTDQVKDYVSILELHNKYVILWFWSPDCSHCRKETPELVKAYNEKLKNFDVSVCAIFLHRNVDEWERFIDDIGKWMDFVIEHKLNTVFHNMWDLYNTTQFRDKFDISSSPVLYLLDKDKKIIAKRIGVEQVVEIIEMMEKDKNKEKK